MKVTIYQMHLRKNVLVQNYSVAISAMVKIVSCVSIVLCYICIWLFVCYFKTAHF